MMKKSRKRGLEELKNRYGLMFIMPWIIGVSLFFVFPLIQSIIYSFSTMTITSEGIITEFKGLENYREILLVDPTYTDSLKSSLTSFCYSLPIILLLSMVIAILLNQKFHGRLFFRALYFIPVIIATGQVMNFIFVTTSSNVMDSGVSDSFSSNMFSVDDILAWLNINNSAVNTTITNIIAKIFDLVWSCGIQIILFIAGLQSITPTLYEAAKVEGATKWEEFWFITFPSLSRVTLLGTVFTMVELITNERTALVDMVYGKMLGGIYDITSAMLWFYFLVSGALMGLVVLMYHRFLMKRWDY